MGYFKRPPAYLPPQQDPDTYIRASFGSMAMFFTIIAIMVVIAGLVALGIAASIKGSGAYPGVAERCAARWKDVGETHFSPATGCRVRYYGRWVPEYAIRFNMH